MGRDRSWRRQQLERQQRRWRNIILNVWTERPRDHTAYLIFEPHNDFDRYVNELSIVRAVTRKPCSCYMCGNPRRYFGQATVQERRAGGD